MPFEVIVGAPVVAPQPASKLRVWLAVVSIVDDAAGPAVIVMELASAGVPVFCVR